MKAWLKFFRIVNAPTVPGDVLAGAAAAFFEMTRHDIPMVGSCAIPIAASCIASLALYFFGLADNDIVGAKTDGPERPIPAGEISLRAARLARGLALFAAMIIGAAANLPPSWWIAAFVLTVAIVLYNRTKWNCLMGLCRGLNVLCGAALLASFSLDQWVLPLGLAAVWTLYIALVTRYSDGEDTDPGKRRRVGRLVGAIVYLQLGVLLVLYLLEARLLLRNALLAGAGLLILLRWVKSVCPKVSAS